MTIVGTHLRKLASLAAFVLLVGSFAVPVKAEPPRFSRPLTDIPDFRDSPPDALIGIGVDEHLGSKLPLDLVFQDEAGQGVQLRQYFTDPKKPVILQMGYYACPMLCSLVSQGTVDSLRTLTLTAGKDFDIVFVSIDPSEKPKLAAAKKETYVQDYHREGAGKGFHFLTGNEEQIKQLAAAVGFKYKWVESERQFSHPAAIMIATPQGVLSRYLYGVRFDSQTLRLSLVEASDGKVGTAMDQIILTCFRYDGKHGKYALFASNLMRLGGALMVLVLAGVLVRAFRHESRRHAAEPDQSTPKT